MKELIKNGIYTANDEYVYIFIKEQKNGDLRFFQIKPDSFDVRMVSYEVNRTILNKPVHVLMSKYIPIDKEVFFNRYNDGFIGVLDGWAAEILQRNWKKQEASYKERALWR